MTSGKVENSLKNHTLFDAIFGGDALIFTEVKNILIGLEQSKLQPYQISSRSDHYSMSYDRSKLTKIVKNGKIAYAQRFVDLLTNASNDFVKSLIYCRSNVVLSSKKIAYLKKVRFGRYTSGKNAKFRQFCVFFITVPP